MVELKKDETIKKGNDRYIHTTKITYPYKNVMNMIKSWKESVSKYEEWLDNYNDFKNVAKQTARESIEKQINQTREEFDKVLTMSKEERYELWLSNFMSQVKELDEFESKKEDIIEEQYNKSLSLLHQYKKTYEDELKNKKEALKKWTKL